MDKKDIKTLIIPDVHGRDFWRKPVEKVLNETDAKIVFLGDYVDPYPHEFVDKERGFDYQKYAIQVLEEIIELKKKYMDRIILLLGNHDCSYAIDTRICECRYDYKNSSKLNHLFKDNRGLFQFAYAEDVHGKHVIYSHAGISKDFAYCVFGKDAVNNENVVGLFNNAWEVEDNNVLDYMSMYDRYRGFGGGAFASIVWTDANEWANGKEGFGDFQIFGHTQLMKDAVITDTWADLDVRTAFYMDNEGKIHGYLED